MEASDKNYANNHQIVFCCAYHWFVRGLMHKAERYCKAGRSGGGSESVKMEKIKIPFWYITRRLDFFSGS